MAKTRFDIVFFIVVSLAVFMLVYLSVHLTSKISDIKDLIRLSGTIILPVPLVIYSLYISVSSRRKIKKQSKKHTLSSIIIFTLTLIISIALIHSFERITQSTFKDNIIVPTLINSSVTVLFALNHITIDDKRAAGFLCGLLLGMAIHIFIFN